jgi:signal peptidase I
VTILRGGPRHGAGPAHAISPPAHRSIWVDIGFTLLATLVASFVLKTFVIQSFYIPSQSMEPTLLIQDRVIVSKLAPGPLDVHRGDVVVFHDPGGWSDVTTTLPGDSGAGAWLHGFAEALGLAPSNSDDFLIKRVIGLPGDEVVCESEAGPLRVNGTPIEEPYVAGGAGAACRAATAAGTEFSAVVPEDAVWVMGDNRGDSRDSRYHQSEALRGAVALDDVVGVAQLRLWPFSRLAVLRNPGATFANVP